MSVLSAVLQTQSSSTSTQPNVEDFVQSLLPLLMKTTLLRDLSYLQRTLDPLDIEGLSALLRTRGETFDTLSLPEPTIDDWDSLVENFTDVAFQSSLDHQRPDASHHAYYTMAYVLSATFKDCSIILRLGQPGSSDTISVIDMEPKGVGKLRKWANLDSVIALAWSDFSTPPCRYQSYSPQ